MFLNVYQDLNAPIRVTTAMLMVVTTTRSSGPRMVRMQITQRKIIIMPVGLRVRGSSTRYKCYYTKHENHLVRQVSG
jgi:hypothetical protein